jgi:hypothetical protein
MKPETLIHNVLQEHLSHHPPNIQYRFGLLPLYLRWLLPLYVPEKYNPAGKDIELPKNHLLQDIKQFAAYFS